MPRRRRTTGGAGRRSGAARPRESARGTPWRAFATSRWRPRSRPSPTSGEGEREASRRTVMQYVFTELTSVLELINFWGRMLFDGISISLSFLIMGFFALAGAAAWRCGRRRSRPTSSTGSTASQPPPRGALFSRSATGRACRATSSTRYDQHHRGGAMVMTMKLSWSRVELLFLLMSAYSCSCIVCACFLLSGGQYAGARLRAGL